MLSNAPLITCLSKQTFVIVLPELGFKQLKGIEKYFDYKPACTGSRATRKMGEASKNRSVKAEQATVLETVPDFSMCSSKPPIPE